MPHSCGTSSQTPRDLTEEPQGAFLGRGSASCRTRKTDSVRTNGALDRAPGPGAVVFSQDEM